MTHGITGVLLFCADSLEGEHILTRTEVQDKLLTKYHVSKVVERYTRGAHMILCYPSFAQLSRSLQKKVESFLHGHALLKAYDYDALEAPCVDLEPVKGNQANVTQPKSTARKRAGKKRKANEIVDATDTKQPPPDVTLADIGQPVQGLAEETSIEASSSIEEVETIPMTENQGGFITPTVGLGNYNSSTGTNTTSIAQELLDEGAITSSAGPIITEPTEMSDVMEPVQEDTNTCSSIMSATTQEVIILPDDTNQNNASTVQEYNANTSNSVPAADHQP